MQKIKVSTLVIHLAGWLLFFSFPLVFFNRSITNDSSFFLILNRFYWEFCVCYVLVFYFNSLYLVPKFFLQKEYLIYFSIVLILLAGIYLLQPFDRLLITMPTPSESNFAAHSPKELRREIPPPPPGNNDFGYNHPPPNQGEARSPFGAPNGNPPEHAGPPHRGGFGRIDTTSLFIFIMMIALGTAAELSERWRLTEQRITQAEAEKATAELSFLKAQINPHFLFNTLNNIYVLALTNNENTAESIMKLSNIMRYVTDDVEDDFVPLQKELDCIEDYIGLQRLRLGKKTAIDFSISGHLENKKIAPLILMPFIENIFKHGISKQESSTLLIKINIEENSISLFCQNPIYQNQISEQRHGIGIANTKQRLQHLYPNKHRLEINTENDFYAVTLTLHN